MNVARQSWRFDHAEYVADMDTVSMLTVPPTLAAVLQTNLTAASRAGTTVTAHASANTKGSWVSLIDPTNNPSYGVWIRALNLRTGGVVTNFLLDLAYGPTGGGNEEIVIPNLGCGAAGAGAGAGEAGKEFFFPVSFPSGVRVSARGQASTGGDTVDIAIWLAQDPLYPWVGGGVVDYGSDLTNSRGTSVAKGSGAFGAWTQLSGGTSRAHRFWTLVLDQLADTTTSVADLLCELGIGPDSGNVTTIFSTASGIRGNETVNSVFPLIGYAPAPSGSLLWARIAGADTEARGVIAYGID